MLWTEKKLHLQKNLDREEITSQRTWIERNYIHNNLKQRGNHVHDKRGRPDREEIKTERGITIIMGLDRKLIVFTVNLNRDGVQVILDLNREGIAFTTNFDQTARVPLSPRTWTKQQWNKSDYGPGVISEDATVSTDQGSQIGAAVVLNNTHHIRVNV